MSGRIVTSRVIQGVTLGIMFIWLVWVAPLAFPGIFNEIIDTVKNLLLQLPAGWADTSTPTIHIESLMDIVAFGRDTSIYEAIAYSALTFFITISVPIVAISVMGLWLGRVVNKT